MTQDELDAIPEQLDARALWQPEEEPAVVTDDAGQCWMIGYDEGVRVKRKL